MLKWHDPYSYEHSIYVAGGMYKVLPYFPEIQEPKEEIITGALLHDVGKITIPEQILNKPGKLSEEEKKIICRHPVSGMEILRDFSLEVKNACLLHHERLDGSGYPYKYTQGFIPDYIQLLSIIDVMEALLGDRPYRKACDTYQKLEEELKDFIFLNQLNPQYVSVILNLIKEKIPQTENIRRILYEE